MLIHCVYSIRDFVLECILIKYISRTPFLVTGKNISYSSFSIDAIPYNADLIVIEADLFLYETIKQIQSKLTNKHFLIFTNIKQLLELPETSGMVILPKNISYFDFIEGLNLLTDNS